jgi:hypothetical protein
MKILYYFKKQLIMPTSKYHTPDEIKTFLNYEIYIHGPFKKSELKNVYYIGATDNRWKNGADNKNLNKRVTYHLNNTLKDFIDENEISRDDIIVRILATHDTGYEALQWERLQLRNNPKRYQFNVSKGGEGIMSKNASSNKIHTEIVDELIDRDLGLYKEIIAVLKNKGLVK